VRGKIFVDAGCAEAIQQKKNLYAAGIVGVEGTFGVMDAIELVFGSTSVARGLTNYTNNVREALMFFSFTLQVTILYALLGAQLEVIVM
jgi:glutamate 5-kinase